VDPRYFFVDPFIGDGPRSYAKRPHTGPCLAAVLLDGRSTSPLSRYAGVHPLGIGDDPDTG